MQIFGKVAPSLRVIRRISHQNARRYNFLATSIKPQSRRGQRTVANSAVDHVLSTESESFALCEVAQPKLSFPQPIAILNLSSIDNMAALNLLFFGNNGNNVVVYRSRSNAQNANKALQYINVSGNESLTPSLMFRKTYSTQKSAEEKGTNPHIVCVAKDGKGCVSPGNADMPMYEGNASSPAATTASKDEPSAATDKSSEGSCGCQKPTVRFAKSPFADFQLLSCDAYQQAICRASKQRQALEAANNCTSVAPAVSGVSEMAIAAQEAPANGGVCSTAEEDEVDLTVVYACGTGESNLVVAPSEEIAADSSMPAMASSSNSSSPKENILFAKDGGCKDDPCKEQPKCVDPCEELMKEKPETETPPKRKRNQMPTGCVSPKCQKQPSKPGSGGCRTIHNYPLVINGTQYASVRCFSSKGGCKKDGDEKIKQMEEELKKQEEDLKKMCEEQKKAEEDAKKKEEDAKKKEADAQKSCADLQKKEEECKKQGEEAKKKEEECKKCIEDMKKKSEDNKKCGEEAKKAAEEAKKKAEELKKDVEDAKKCLEEAKNDLEDAKKCNEAKKVLNECKNKKKGGSGDKKGCGGDKKDSPCKDKDKKSPCSSNKDSKPSCGGDKKGFATFAAAEPLTLDTSNLVKRHFGTFKIHNGLTVKNFGFDPRFFSSKKTESSGGKCRQGTVMPKNRKKDPNARPKDGLTTGCFSDNGEECPKPKPKGESACDTQFKGGKDPFPGGCKKNKGMIYI